MNRKKCAKCERARDLLCASVMLHANQTIASVVLDHPECARVLSKHRIDYCCRGERSVGDACRQRGIEPAELIDELQRAIAIEPPGVDLRALSTGELIEHIVTRHHRYLREALPFVATLSAKVARVHGESNERLVSLGAIVEELREMLEPHLDHEEARLFPALLASERDADYVGRELDAMLSEHQDVGALLWRMRAAADDYRVPEWACRSYRTLFAELEKLEADVLVHVHAENYVLKPRYEQPGSG
jgi:regulator of cell morphogenesis and NO signaling